MGHVVPPPAGTGTHASDAAETARIEAQGARPRHLRYNIWNPEGDVAATTAEWTLTAKPLPRQPQHDLENELIAVMLKERPDLFKITTPIHVDVLEAMLVDHPNQPFVTCVLAGLREGFWPWADAVKVDYPDVLDKSRSVRTTAAQEDFFKQQLEHEQARGRHSPAIGDTLLPGMCCMPIYAVPKPASTDFRLVNDHSASCWSLNSMIGHDQVTGYPLDNLAQFGDMLMQLKKEALGEGAESESLTVHSRSVPALSCLAWQIKQAVPDRVTT